MIKMEGGQEAICVKTIHPVIGQKFLIPKVKKKGNVKKTNDKNRFILNKEIVEKKWNCRYFKKDNVPSTVDVLRAGKIKQTADELKNKKNDLVDIQASNSVYVGSPLCWLKNIS